MYRGFWSLPILGFVLLTGCGGGGGGNAVTPIPTRYVVTALDAIPSDSDSTLIGWNRSNAFVGINGYNTQDYTDNRAYLFQNGVMTLLEQMPGGGKVAPFAMNDAGDVVGAGGVPFASGQNHAFLYHAGKTVDLAGSNTNLSIATAINNNMQVAGTYSPVGQGISHAFLWQNGQWTDLGVLPDNNESEAVGINLAGQVIGSSSHVVQTVDLPTVTNQRGFLWQGGQMRDLGAFEPASINDPGQIVGGSRTTAGDQRVQIWQDGRLTDLGVPQDPARTYLPTEINNHGQVVGRIAGIPFSKNSAFLYSGGKLVDLKTRIPTSSGFVIDNALHIHEDGTILAHGALNGVAKYVLLTPQ